MGVGGGGVKPTGNIQTVLIKSPLCIKTISNMKPKFLDMEIYFRQPFCKYKHKLSDILCIENNHYNTRRSVMTLLEYVTVYRDIYILNTYITSGWMPRIY